MFHLQTGAGYRFHPNLLEHTFQNLHAGDRRSWPRSGYNVKVAIPMNRLRNLKLVAAQKYTCLAPLVLCLATPLADQISMGVCALKQIMFLLERSSRDLSHLYFWLNLSFPLTQLCKLSVFFVRNNACLLGFLTIVDAWEMLTFQILVH